MTAVQDLIAKQQEMNTPPEPPKQPSRLERAIAKQKEAHENAPWEPVQVILGGEVVTVEIRVILGGEWGDLEATHPATTKADLSHGYNPRTLPRDYPVERLRVAGEQVSQETWAALYDCLPDEHRDSISAVMWGLNVWEPQQRLDAARKAKAAPAPTMNR